MKNETTEIEALTEALEAFTDTTKSMEEAYRRLEERIRDLDRELAQKNRQLAFTSEYLGNLLESMSDGVIAVDNDGVITRFNHAARAILGYEAAEAVGRPFEEVFGRDFAAGRFPGALEMRANSGRLVPVNERDSVITDHVGNRLGQVKIFEDLTELIALREQVRQMDRLAAIGEMAATVAHEIRNPLGGIRGFATFLAQDIPPDDPRRRLVDKILEGSKSLDNVVNDLLEYTRPVELRLVQTNCCEAVDSALGYLEMGGKAIAVANQVPSTLKILGDPEKIRQVFLNVLLNAVQSVEQEGDITISALDDADPSYVIIRFEDTGCGMPEDQLRQVFSPFFTTKERGTGLGLAICAKIVEGHGGKLEASSVVGEGSVFSVRLPRAE